MQKNISFGVIQSGKISMLPFRREWKLTESVIAAIYRDTSHAKVGGEEGGWGVTSWWDFTGRSLSLMQYRETASAILLTAKCYKSVVESQESWFYSLAFLKGQYYKIKPNKRQFQRVTAWPGCMYIQMYVYVHIKDVYVYRSKVTLHFWASESAKVTESDLCNFWRRLQLSCTTTALTNLAFSNFREFWSSEVKCRLLFEGFLAAATWSKTSPNVSFTALYLWSRAPLTHIIWTRTTGASWTSTLFDYKFATARQILTTGHREDLFYEENFVLLFCEEHFIIGS